MGQTAARTSVDREREQQQYIYVDTAFGGLNRRNNLILASDLEKAFKEHSSRKKPTECFTTYFRYPEEMKQHFVNSDNSVEKYPGPVYSDSVPIDIDDKKDLAIAHENAKKVVRLLEDRGIDPNVLRIVFSGSKGFHIEIPSILFGIEPSKHLNDVIKRMVRQMLPDIPIDPANYDKVRLWRLPNSINNKSGLYCIPLSVHELLTLTIDDIKALARKPRNGTAYWDDATELNPELHNFYLETEKNLDKTTDNQVPGKAKLTPKEMNKKCAFMAHAYQNSNLSEPLWYAMVSNLSRVSPGGPSLCQEYSLHYPKYNQQEVNEKILQAQDNAGPHTCQWIKENGFDCKKDCGVKAPIVQIQREERTEARNVEEDPVKEEWPEPIPLDDSDSLPSFPVNSLPLWCRQMAEEVAEVNQVDSGMAGSIILGTLATAVMKKAVVDLITHREPLNGSFASVSGSGERKTTTAEVLTKPIYLYQKDRRDELAPIVAEDATDRRILENKREKLEKQAAKAQGDEYHKIVEQAKSIARQLAETSAITTPTYVVDDVTTEQLGFLAAENGEKMAVISAEGGIFDTLGGKYSNGFPSFDLYLKGYSGDHWSNDRIGRKHLSMESPALTVCLTVQPDIIRQFGEKREFRGRGLTARFLYSMCSPRAGYRPRQKKAIDATVEQKYHTNVRQLLDLQPVGAILQLNAEAHARWDAFYDQIEVQMRKGGRLSELTDWGSKLPGAVARIAGLLHFAKHGANATKKMITEDTVNDACAIGEYYLEHVFSVFGLMGQDPRVEAAKKILEFIQVHKPAAFKGRDVLQIKSAFKTMEDLQPGLIVLNDRGFIRGRGDEYKGRGRPESTIYDVNPKVFNNSVSIVTPVEIKKQPVDAEEDSFVTNDPPRDDASYFIPEEEDDEGGFIGEDKAPPSLPAGAHVIGTMPKGGRA